MTQGPGNTSALIKNLLQVPGVSPSLQQAAVNLSAQKQAMQSRKPCRCALCLGIH